MESVLKYPSFSFKKFSQVKNATFKSTELILIIFHIPDFCRSFVDNMIIAYRNHTVLSFDIAAFNAVIRIYNELRQTFPSL